MKITPHISVPNAKKTIEVYKELFNVKLVDHMPFTKEIGKGMGLPEDFDYENSTMHSVLELDGTEIYVADSMIPKQAGPVEIVLHFDDKVQIEKVWKNVKKMNLHIIMELGEQFWGAIYGRFIDNDGVGWQLNYTKPNV